MKSLLSLCLFGLLALAAPGSAGAADADWNGLDDSAQAPGGGPFVQDGLIAVVDTGDGSVGNFGTRLTGLGYSVSTIPMNSDYSVLSQYDCVVLPVGHGSTCCYNNFNALAEDYLRYVYDGGCLYVGQPNPYDHPGGEATITWVPFALRLNAFYDLADCPPSIVDPEHCVAQGLAGYDLPFPGDTVLEMGPEWQVVTVGQATGNPGVLVGSYGAGSINVELAHPSPQALCPYTDAGLLQMVECCLGPPVPTQKATWGGLKSLYR